MEAKYGEAISAGVTGGVIAAILFVAIILIGIFVADVTWFTLSELGVWVLLAAVMLLTGVLAVARSKQIVNVDDATVTSSFAGGIAGFIGALVFAIAIAVVQFFVQYEFLAGMGRFEVLASRSMLSLICGGVSCGLMPIIMLVAIVLAAIGGLIYWLARKK